MNCLSSHRIVRECSEYRGKGFRRLSGIDLALEGALLRTADAGSESRRRSGGELELRRRRGPRRGHRRQPYPLQIGPDRGRIGQGGDDSQATATGRAFAEVTRAQGRPPQAMAAGRSARSAVRRLDSSTGLVGTMRPRSPGRQDPVVAQEMEPGRGDQSCQLLQQVHRREQEMAGPIRPRCFEREGKAFGIQDAQTPRRQGRPGHVAA